MKNRIVRFRSVISLILSIALVLSLFPSASVYAAEEDLALDNSSDQVEEVEETTEEVTSEEPESIPILESEEVTTEVMEVVEETTESNVEDTTESPVVIDTSDIDSIKQTEEIKEIGENTEETEVEVITPDPIPTFDHVYDGVNVSGKDFSSCELLISGDSSIFTADTQVISEYNGIYLTRYADPTQTMYAYTYYYNKASLVLVNSNIFKAADEVSNNESAEEDTSEPVSESAEQLPTDTEETVTDTEETTEKVIVEEVANDGHGEADLSNINSGSDAFSTVNSLPIGNYAGYIALIDSGASGSVVKASVSVLGDGAGDNNGHGSRMAAKIAEANPNANVLSIKALDSAGYGQPSDIYAAIQYAIDCNVSVINLSLASINSAESSIVVDAINKALASGITVVGAAGNYGSNASYFVPGCIGGVITCTATDDKGIRLSNSNYGSAVDYYVVADSSSEAAAYVSGLISKDGLGFSSDLVRTEDTEEGCEDATITDATIGTETETDSVEEVKATEEAKELNNQANLNEHLEELFPWLGGTFAAQAPTGYPNSFTADVWFNQTTDHANADGVIGYLADWNVRSININQYDYVAGSQAVYCGCVSRGVASVSHSYSNTGGGHTHYSGPAGAEHLCITPGAQAGNWNRLQISNTTFVYVDQITYNGLSYARYKTTDGVDQFLDTAGVQYVDIYVYLRLTEQPGFISLHKAVKKQNGSASSVSPAGAKYGLYDDEHPDTNGNTKIAEFTLGSDGWPSNITLTTARAGSSDGVVNGDDGHKYLKWVSQTTPQNWYFKEISAPAGLLLDTGTTSIQYSWTTKHAEVTDIEFAGLVEIFKYDPDGTGNRGYGLSGGVFNVRNAAGTTIGTITTNASGYGYFGGLAPGNYSIVEATAPQYHVKDNNVYSFTIRNDGTLTTNPTPTTNTATYQTWNNGVNNNNSSKVSLALANADAPVYATLKKSSANPSCTNGNPNYNLNGTTYGLYTSAANATNKTNAIHTFTINAAGNTTAWNVSSYMAKNATTGAYRATTLYLRELTAGTGYELSNSVIPITVQPSNGANNPATANVSDKPLLDPVRITINKQNLDGSSVPEGSGSLEGAQFTIKYFALSVNNEYTASQLNAMTPNSKWTIQTKQRSDGAYVTRLDTDFLVGSNNSSFYYETGNNVPMLPLGWIIIEETKAPEGYTNENAQFKLNSQGSVEDYDGQIVVAKTDVNGSLIVSNQPYGGDITVLEKPIRGDFEIEKVNYEGTALEGVEFSITNNDTGESYNITTDEYGKYSSEDAGLWFSLKTDGSETDKIDGLRGLPYGSYTLTETIPLNGYQKEESITFNVTDNVVYKVYDLGRGDGLQMITDMELPTLGTKALVETVDGESKVLPAAPGQTIHDICSYNSLKCGMDYTLIGKLMEIKEDGSVIPYMQNGEEVTGITHFRTTDTYNKSIYEASGEEIVEFADLDFTDKEGTSFVVFERLYLGDITEEDANNDDFEKNYPGDNDTVEFPLIHEDAADSEQTVTVPSGHTDAYVVSNGGKTAYSDSKVELTDIVYYEGLEVGKEYTLKTNIYIYEDDELLEDEEGEVREWTSSFTPTEANGQTEITVELDLSEYMDKTLVFFEEVKDKDIRMFLNADINDIPESIHVPYIKTRAYGVDDLKIAYAGVETTVFTDNIDYWNIEGSTEYTAVGYIMDAETGEAIEQDGKPLMAMSTFTTPASNRGNNGVDGVAEVVFEFKNAREVLEGRDIVIFEELYLGENTEKENLIAEHKDLSDTEQQLKFIKIGTLAYDKDDKDKLLKPDGHYELIDEVSFSNIDISAEYKLVGTIMNKETGEAFLDSNGKPITSEVEFTSKETDGTINVEFSFDTSENDMYLVVFEELYIKDDSSKWHKVEEHTDISDEGQTIKIGSKGRLSLDKNNKDRRGRGLRTGDSFPAILITIIMIVSLASGAVIVTLKKRRSK